MDEISHLTCKICDQRAHGNHFGVISCRACAAFFRRAADSKWSKMPCRGASCHPKKYFCKPCRLKQCKAMGMDTTKFQYSTLVPVPAQFKLPQTVESFVGRSEFFLFCEPDHQNEKILIDVRYLLEEAAHLLNSGPETPSKAESQLRKLNLGFKYIKLDSEKIGKMDRTGQAEIMDMWHFYFITVTKWLMYFDEFQKLNRFLQMTLLQSIWHVWGKLHKVVCTSSYRKLNFFVKDSVIIYRNMIMDMENMDFDMSWMSDYSTNEVMRFMSPKNCHETDPMNDMVLLEPTDVEITYMFAQLCFEYVGKRYQGDILKVTDSFQKILSDDLHDYYVNDLKIPRYFYRLSKMMKINASLQRTIRENRAKSELGRIFNVLKLEFSHPEMFEDSGFY